jgi:hypothetical protein
MQTDLVRLTSSNASVVGPYWESSYRWFPARLHSKYCRFWKQTINQHQQQSVKERLSGRKKKDWRGQASTWKHGGRRIRLRIKNVLSYYRIPWPPYTISISTNETFHVDRPTLMDCIADISWDMTGKERILGKFHQIQSIRGLTHPASANSQDSFQPISMTLLLVCVKDDEHGLQLEPEGLESWNTAPYPHFRNFNPN